MPRARALRPSFFTHEYLATCDPIEALLFAGLWTEADRMGRLEDRPVQLKARLLPMRTPNIVELLDRLEAAGLIARYVIGDRRLIWIPKFVDQQKTFTHPNESASRLPPHPADINRESGKGVRQDLPRRSKGGPKQPPKEVRSKSDHSDHSDHSDRSDSLLSPTAPAARTASWQETVFGGIQKMRAEKLAALEIKAEAETVRPAFLNTVLRNIAERMGGADDTDAQVRILDVYALFCAEPWAANCDKGPFHFGAFASEKVWPRLVDQLLEQVSA